MWVYDPGRDAWRDGPALPEPMSAMAVGVLDDALHVVGGEDPAPISGGVSDDHFVLAHRSDRWVRLGPPLLPVHGAGFGTFRDRLFVVGGASRQGALFDLEPERTAARKKGAVLNRTVDALRERFGFDVIRRASAQLPQEPGLGVRPGDGQ